MKEETKEKASKIWNDIKAGLKTGFSATKKGLSKAGTAIQNYGDLGMVLAEKKQFESKVKKAYASLGELVATKLSAKNAVPLTAEDAEVSELLKTISNFNKEISKREKILKSADKGSGEKAAAKKASAKKTTKSAK